MAGNFAEDVSINLFDLENDLVNHASIVAYWNEVRHQAELAYRNFKIEFDDWTGALESMKREEVRESMRRRGDTTKPTEAQVDREVRQDASWKQRKRRLNELELEVERLKGRMKALDHRKDTLVSLAHSRRQEIRSFAMPSG